MSLKEYRRKRKFDKTPEPSPEKSASRSKNQLRFVVQKHAASRTHYDFRLELDGALKSWAVPRGPSLMSNDPRLAVHVEDHPLAYGEFEGAIPKGNYGAGTVMVWDEGTYVERQSKGRKDSEAALRAGLAKGHITFILQGKKLRGEFALVKIKNPKAEENAWLLVKKHDAEATRKNILEEDRSVASGRTMEEIAEQAPKKNEIWLPRKGRATDASTLQKPMEPVFALTPPTGKGWVFEPFARGVRAMAEVTRTSARLVSRSLIPLEKKYPTVIAALKKLKTDALLDGEVLKVGTEVVFQVGDILRFREKDLRKLPLIRRKKILEELTLKSPLVLAPWGTEVAKVVASTGTLVAKKESSTYQSGLTKEWLRFRWSGRPSPQGIGGDKPPVTHPEKVYFPGKGYTKRDLIDYYDKVADIIVPHLMDRPQSLHRQPDGIRNEGFFHKDMASFLPRRIQTIRIESGSSGRTVNYALCQDRWSLLFLANMGCIELNPWLSRRQSLDKPDLLVVDLDPDDNDFKQVVQVAKEVHKVLKAVGAESFCKTSGSTGLHICVPLGARFSYDEARDFAEAVCRVVHQKLPKFTSIERNPAKRRGKIYLDFMQNRRSQTLAAPYCVRPRPKATVSTPLKWSEVKAGLNPEAFTIETMERRIKKMGDLWKPLLTKAVDIAACRKRLSKRFHI